MNPDLLIIDLFCGAGGTTTGFVRAKIDGKSIAKVIACINHDPMAIKSHWRNHKSVKHFEEDIRTLDLTELIELVNYYRIKYPLAKIILWASLECTNFSKAKGGVPRDADSRTLADHLLRYIIKLDPDFVWIENVVEFMAWGPLDENGKPISKRNGADFLRWRREICSLGYHDQWKEINSADFGAYTSRNRLFGQFAKTDLSIVWPLATHSKKPQVDGMFGALKKWKPVREVLDLEKKGVSIFDRKKPLSDKTLARIYAGLIKFVAGGKDAFIQKYYSGKPEGKVNDIESPAGTIRTSDALALVQMHSGKVISLEGPAGVVTCIDHHSLVQVEPFMVKYNSMDKDGKYCPPDLEQPSPVVPTRNMLYLCHADFLSAYYGNGANVSGTDEPAPTLTTKDRLAFIQVNHSQGKQHSDPEKPLGALTTVTKENIVTCKHFIQKDFTRGDNNKSINDPNGALLPNPKENLVECRFILDSNFNNGPQSIDEPAKTILACRKHQYIINPAYFGHASSIENPSPVIVARQDKAPLGVVTAETGEFVGIIIYPEDSENMKLIKHFMAVYGIIDIYMRMLLLPELLRIQGFGDKYILEGTQTDKKKFIGNAVHPIVPKCMAEKTVGDLRLINIKSKAA